MCNKYVADSIDEPTVSEQDDIVLVQDQDQTRMDFQAGKSARGSLRPLLRGTALALVFVVWLAINWSVQNHT